MAETTSLPDTVSEAIVAELRRQYEAGDVGLGWFTDWRTDASGREVHNGTGGKIECAIDGNIDVAALSRAVLLARKRWHRRNNR